MYRELDLIIQDHCLSSSRFVENNEVDDQKYDMLKKEINAHLYGGRDFKSLSPVAQRIFQVWETWRAGK